MLLNIYYYENGEFPTLYRNIILDVTVDVGKLCYLDSKTKYGSFVCFTGLECSAPVPTAYTRNQR